MSRGRRNPTHTNAYKEHQQMYLDNKYTRWYYNIIEQSKLRNHSTKKSAKESLGYVEKHHIIPKCIGGSDESSNLAYLTAKEHFVCHHLLTKMFDDVDISRKMRFALNKMSHKSDNQSRLKITAKLFDKIRRDFAKDISIINKNRKYKSLTDEQKQRISISSKGVSKSKQAVINLTISNRKNAQINKEKFGGHPSKGKKLGPNKSNGKPKIKTVCRLIDQKEMDMGNFTIWINRQL